MRLSKLMFLRSLVDCEHMDEVYDEVAIELSGMNVSDDSELDNSTNGQDEYLYKLLTQEIEKVTKYDKLYADCS